MLAVYRNQFYEIERDLVAGSLRASEAEAARIKVSRGAANEKQPDWRRGSGLPVGRNIAAGDDLHAVYANSEDVAEGSRLANASGRGPGSSHRLGFPVFGQPNLKRDSRKSNPVSVDQGVFPVRWIAKLGFPLLASRTRSGILA